MKRLTATFLLIAPIILPFTPEPVSRALAQNPVESEITAREAFEAARTVGTVEAFNVFLATFPTGFYADLARVYINRLDAGGAAPPPAAATPRAQPAQPAQPAPTQAPAPAPAGSAGAVGPGRAAVARGGQFMGFPERFNRYYTDPAWKPSRVVYVSPNGQGNGASRETAASVRAAVAGARPGTLIYFLRGNYQGCFEFGRENSGTYDEPIVLYGERTERRMIGVAMRCCTTGRGTCFNLENSNYIAVDGFELIGGQYGVRTVGAGYDASQHARGIAVLNCNGHDQNRDPFFSGQSDWAVWEGLVGHGAKDGDGHGIYISNGSDWNIVRFNETFNNVSSDFQINADPDSTCKAEGIAFDDPRCDAYAGTGEGGRGASDYFLVEGNYFHHSVVGPNFASVRRSVVRNNIFGPQARHNATFYQETDNPRLGSSENKIVHNLFITTERHAIRFGYHSTRNTFANNIILSVRFEGGRPMASPYALAMEVDDTVSANVYSANLYIGGRFEGRQPNAQERARPDFSPAWFRRFTPALTHNPNDFTPAPGAPFAGAGAFSPDAPLDRNGAPRSGQVDIGPINAPR